MMASLLSFFHVSTQAELLWVVFGFAAQLFFTARFLVQWLASEKARKSVMPVAFWYFSMLGGVMLLAYAIHRADPVFILGQALGVVIYARNLWLIHQEGFKRRFPGLMETTNRTALRTRLAATGARLGHLAIRRPAATLLLVCALAMLPGFFTLPVVDRDEARFSQATHQMLETGDYITPHLGSETRFKKPIGIYWLQAAAVKLTGMAENAPIWAYRIPSLLAAFGSVFLVWRIGRQLFGPQAGLIAALLLAVTPILETEARLAKTDSVLLFCALLAQMALLAAYRDKARVWATPLLFWGALGAGILIKGPIVPLLSGLTVLALVAWERKGAWLKALRPLIGVPFLLLMVLPWFLIIAIQHGGDFFQESVGKDLLGKVAAGQESHGAWPGTHLLTAPLAYWPGFFFVLMALPWVWKERHRPEVRFCVAWLAPFWLVFELIVTKLPHYTLPAIPAAMLLAGAALMSGFEGLQSRWRKVLPALAVLPGLVLAIGLPVAYRVLGGSTPPFVAIVIALIAILFGLVAIMASVRGQTKASLGYLVGQAVAVSLLAFGLLMPRLDMLWLSPRLAEVVRTQSTCPAPEIMVSGMGEASLLFYLGSQTTFGEGADAAAFLQQPGCRVVMVEARQKAAFEQSQTPDLMPHHLQTVAGMNLATGKKMLFEVFDNARP